VADVDFDLDHCGYAGKVSIANVQLAPLMAQATMRNLSILALALLVFGAQAESSVQAAEPEIHYSPVENLEHFDLALIESATKSVDMTAYSLTDWAIIEALKRARARGVTIRIVLDPSQHQEYGRLAEMVDIVRVKKRRWEAQVFEHVDDVGLGHLGEQLGR
jgi:phosphatidylserine/phosphatidylglycerophosphate/cardiolipin synthase-like enzyme